MVGLGKIDEVQVSDTNTIPDLGLILEAMRDKSRRPIVRKYRPLVLAPRGSVKHSVIVWVVLFL